MLIKLDSLDDGAVVGLLEEHLADMYANSPAESVHALDITALKDAAISFYSCWQSQQLMGCVAIKMMTAESAEIKSMRTATAARQSGVATLLLEHLLVIAQQRGVKTLYLETGSMDFFKPARSLYQKFGFDFCPPFADYKADPHSYFMSRTL